MCLTSSDAGEERMVWEILCDECKVKAEAFQEKRKARSLFDIDIKEYGFCSECTAEINDAFQRLMKAEFGDEIP